jgi:hypothetical protein
VLEPLPQGSTPLPAGLLQLQQEEVAAAAVLPCAEQQTHVAIPTSEQGEARIAATTFTEEADLDAGAYLLTHWGRLIPRSLRSLHSKGQSVPPERALELFLLSARARRVEVTYRKSKSESEQGRWHALKSRSLQCLSRVVRHTMCVGRYVDVDVVNAHPTLLLHLCRQSNWECPQLSAYVKDRDDLLTDLCGVAGCSRDHAKQVYLAVLNGGDEDFNNLPRRSKHLEAFRDELAVLRLKLTQQHSELYAQVKARRSEAGKTWNNESGLLSLLCNRLENRVLMSMWCFFGCPTNCVLCFDGIMLRRAGADGGDVVGGYDLAGCAAHVQRELGVAIQLAAKPFDKCVTLPREQVRDSFRRWLLPARFDPAKLHQLTKACTDESILEAMEPAQRKLAEEELQNKKKDGLVGKAFALNVTAMLEYVNQYYFTVKGSTTVHCFEEHDAQGRVVEEICFTNKKALLEHLEDFKVLRVSTDQGLRNNKQAVGQLWLEYQQRRIYYKQKFAPNTTLAYTHQGFNERNMWTGWRYEQQEGFVVDTNLIARLVAHLLDVICAGQVELYTYLLKLWKLVLMGKKTGVALCVTGAQGSGKSLMVEYFGRAIIGDNHYAFFQTLDDLTGRFSSERCFKSFIVCDELGTWSGDHGTANKLKSLITQTRTKLERKGIDPRTVEDCSNFVFLSNDKDIVKVEGKADRRYCVVEASNHRLGDSVYFNALALDMGLEPEDSRLTEAQRQHAYSVGEHFFHFVLAQDVRGFKPSRIPATGIRQRLQAAATPPLAAFVRWFVDAYTRELASKGSGGAVRVKAANLFDGYERLMQYLGSPVKFLRAPELSKALKCKFQLFTDCAHRCASGTYFASTDPQRLEREARDLDSAHVFNTGMYQDVDFQFAEEN